MYHGVYCDFCGFDNFGKGQMISAYRFITFTFGQNKGRPRWSTFLDRIMDFSGFYKKLQIFNFLKLYLRNMFSLWCPPKHSLHKTKTADNNHDKMLYTPTKITGNEKTFKPRGKNDDC